MKQLTPASLRGVIMTPLEKIFATLSFVIYFAHRFLRKKMNGRRKFSNRKKFEKKYMGGSPESPNLAKILKNISKNINLPVCCHFTIWRDKLNLKVDSESLDMYLTPCKKLRDRIYTFPAIVVWSWPIFADFAAATNFRGNSYFWRFFAHFSQNKSQLQTFITQRVYKLET